VPIGVVIGYTDALPKAFSYERVRSTLLHCTNDGLERLSDKCTWGQAVTQSIKCLSPFCLHASQYFEVAADCHIAAIDTRVQHQ
jgi:hypothetical protein